ncbi:hypothetical protein PIB30_063857 [Stylosanthes scabra]|uniref:Uncharacterized protein n=1 Tax=Stylosanthes scabra TaxID=79078 RepID=A0ABU6QM98_9FABA|nr:hypothetical protein [Stylosanthes scabra]
MEGESSRRRREERERRSEGQRERDTKRGRDATEKREEGALVVAAATPSCYHRRSFLCRRRPVAIASSLLENRERERKNDGKRRTKGCLRCRRALCRHYCQEPPCLRKPPFQAAVLEPQSPLWSLSHSATTTLFWSPKMVAIAAIGAAALLLFF